MPDAMLWLDEKGCVTKNSALRDCCRFMALRPEGLAVRKDQALICKIVSRDFLGGL
jgi:hypothetical protein